MSLQIRGSEIVGVWLAVVQTERKILYVSLDYKILIPKRVFERLIHTA